MSDHINELYDKNGNLIGALITGEGWAAVRDQVMAALGVAEKSEPERPEPLSDWETLKQYWDFPYPVDTDVHCEICGASTEDWAADEPRVFRLSSANLAGLVAFQCMHCQAKVIKRHFKDKITSESRPYQSEKNTSKEGRY